MELRRETAVVLCSMAVLAASVAVAGAERLPDVERAVFRSINGAADLPFAPLWLAMQLGNVAALAGAAVVVARRDRPRAAGIVLAGGVAAYVLAKLVKRSVVRPRPAALVAGVELRGAPSVGLGFPAGHAAVAAFIATAVAPHLGRSARVALVVWACVVGLLRVYVGAHLPLDVVAGGAIGVVCGLVARRVAARVGPPALGA